MLLNYSVKLPHVKYLSLCCDFDSPRIIIISRSIELGSRLRLKRDGTRAETRFRLSPKRTSPFKWAGASVQSTAGSRGVRISGSNAGYSTFRGSVKSTGYPPHSPVSPLPPLPCVTLCHQVSNALYYRFLTTSIVPQDRHNICQTRHCCRIHKCLSNNIRGVIDK